MVVSGEWLVRESRVRESEVVRWGGVGEWARRLSERANGVTRSQPPRETSSFPPGPHKYAIILATGTHATQTHFRVKSFGRDKFQPIKCHGDNTQPSVHHPINRLIMSS